MDLIVAVDQNWGIGYGGTQTIVIPEDRHYFRELTIGETMIVGHRTLLDFPGKKPLPGRRNIVISRNKDLKIDGADVVTSLDELFKALGDTDLETVHVVGGGTVFKMLLDYCQYAYVTKIKAAPESDAFFPNLDEMTNWSLDKNGETKTYNGIEYVYLRYRNSTPLHYTDK
ncbi:dihydrofolate reductase [Oscillospiraceae bacterium CM]|nr:dihydrofolate reductase [Oscillospiraceae bacterium CM]